MDPVTLRCVELNAAQYFGDGSAFKPLANRKQTRLYYVMDVRPLGLSRHKLHHAEVDLVPEERIGDEGAMVSTNTHLGAILQPGDLVACYDNVGMQLDEHEDLAWFYGKQKNTLPDVIPIRKIYSRRRKRKWKLKEMQGVEPLKYSEDNKRGRDDAEAEREQFFRDIEEDVTGDLRDRIDIYPDPDILTESESNMEDGDVAPQVPRAEMLQINAPPVQPTPPGFLQTR